MRALVTFLLAAPFSAALTRLFLALSTGRAVVAEENNRTMHKGKVPVGAGWPLLAAALATALILWPVTRMHANLLPWIAVLALVSWADDMTRISPAVRFPIHAIAALAAVFALPETARVFGGVLPLVPDRLLTTLALVWLINLTNFMDGIDGISGVEVLSVGIGYVLVRTSLPGASVDPLVGLMSATAGAALGFLIWNWHPARVFLGDVGAIPLGFIMGIAMIDLAVVGQFASAVILPLYYVSDATITLLKRLSRGAAPWDAHREHFYQRAALGAGSHAPIVIRVAACNAMLVGAALVAVQRPWIGCAIAGIAVAVLMANLEMLARRRIEPEASGAG